MRAPPPSVLRLAIAFLFLAFAPSTASADSAVTGARVTDSLSVAESFWRTTPVACPLGVTVYQTDSTDSAYTSPEGAPCSIWIGTETLTEPGWDGRVDTCNAIVHEFGHLLGYAHSTNPRSIMHPSPSVVAQVCLRRFRPKPRKGWHYSPVRLAVW